MTGGRRGVPGAAGGGDERPEVGTPTLEPMNELLSTVLISASLLLALLAVGYVALDRATGPVLVAGFALLELLLALQLALGLYLLRATSREVDGVVFVGYLVGTLAFVPAGVWWALGERSRAGTAALVIVGLVVPVLVLRMGQIWDGAA